MGWTPWWSSSSSSAEAALVRFWFIRIECESQNSRYGDWSREGRLEGSQSWCIDPAASTQTGWCQSHCLVLQPSQQHKTEGLGGTPKAGSSTEKQTWTLLEESKETSILLKISLTLEDVRPWACLVLCLSLVRVSHNRYYGFILSQSVPREAKNSQIRIFYTRVANGTQQLNHFPMSPRSVSNNTPIPVTAKCEQRKV